MNHSVLPEKLDEPATPPDILHQLCICGDTEAAHSFIHNVREKKEEFEWSCDLIRLAELRYLTLSDLHLRKTDYFISIPKLKYLNVSFNNISDISPFASLIDLEVLDISHNKITDLTALRGLRSLKLLRCHSNTISTLEPVNDLTNIEELWLNENKLSWDEVIHLQPLTKLRRLAITGNPCEEKPKFYDFLLSLCPLLKIINGVKVFASEKELKFQERIVPADFLKSNEGRTMLNQSRAHLTTQQRTHLQSTLSTIQSPIKPPDQLGTSRSLPESRTQEPGSPKKNITQKIHKYKAKKLQQLYAAESAAATLDPTDAQIVRFSGKSSAPIALCVDAAGCGYMRWAENGSIACSYDRDRLFCAYSNGAIAAVYDAHHNGSIMDPNGTCLLGIQSNGIAVQRDINGNIVQTYTRNSVEECYVSSWSFDNVQIDFNPNIWELKIVLSNSRLQCQFTNIEGGKLLQVFDVKKEKAKKEKHRTMPLVSVDEHDSVRHGVKEVLSQLDDILAGIKKK